MPLLPVGARVRLNDAGKRRWRGTEEQLTYGTITRVEDTYPGDVSGHYYDVNWDRFGNFSVYDIDVQALDPKFNIELAIPIDNVDDAIQLATTIAQSTGHSFKVTNV